MSAIINPRNPFHPMVSITLYRVRIDLISESGEQRTVYSDYSEQLPPAWEVIHLASNMVRHVDDVYLKSVTVEKTNWIKSEGDH